MPSNNKYDPRVPAKKASMTRGQSAAAKRAGAQANAVARGYKAPVTSVSNRATNAYADRMTALANAYSKGADPQGLAAKVPGYSPTVGVNPPQSSGSGGSGGFSSGGPSAPTVGESAAPTLEQMLGMLPQSPTGVTETQGAYQALMDRFKESEARSGQYFDEASTKLREIFGQANQGYSTGNTDYLQQLQQLGQQNQATALGSLQGLKAVRGNFMNDMGTSIAARSASSVNDIVTAFNEAKAQKEAQMVEEYLAMQAEMAAAQGGSSGSGGGSGGGGRSYGGGSGGSSGPTTITDAASETGLVTNPQNVAMLMELAKTDPQAAAFLQREMDLSYGGALAGIRKTYDAGASSGKSNASKAAFLGALGNIAFGKAKTNIKTKAGTASAAAAKSQRELTALQKALDTARGFGGVYANPKVTQQVKTSSSKKTKYK